MLSELKELFAVWIAAVAAAMEAIVTRFAPRRRVLFVEREPGNFTARVISPGKGAVLPQFSFRLANGRPEPAFGGEWQAALRGSRIEVVMRSDQVLFRTIDFPKAAADFLDGMVRAQVDRLTPWTAADAVFGITAPEPIAGDRIAREQGRFRVQLVQELVDDHRLEDRPPVEEQDGNTAHRGHLEEPGGLVGKLDELEIVGKLLLGTSLAAAASLAVASYVGSALDAEQQDLSRQSAQRRAALGANQGGGSAETLLAKRKQTQASSVMVLEAISRALPDTTYVTELRVEGDKVQVVGLTQDAPSLIKLMEQSPQFARATFFAPTTRGQDEQGERFHIEAHITPYFGSGS